MSLETDVLAIVDEIKTTLEAEMTTGKPLEGLKLVRFGGRQKEADLIFPSVVYMIRPWSPIPDIATIERHDIPFQFVALVKRTDSDLGNRESLQWLLKVRDVIYDNPMSSACDKQVQRMLDPRPIPGSTALYGTAMNMLYTIMTD